MTNSTQSAFQIFQKHSITMNRSDLLFGCPPHFSLTAMCPHSIQNEEATNYYKIIQELRAICECGRSLVAVKHDC